MKNIKRIEKNEGELTFFEIFAVTDFFFPFPLWIHGNFTA